MPLADMPLEELKQYKGITPCPKDFDRFWEEAVKELHAIDPEPELVPARFQVPDAECFDLYFTGMDCSRIHAKYLRPKDTPKAHPAVIQFHGYADSSGPWNLKLNYVSQGYSVAALDVRGQAGDSEDLGARKGNTYHGQVIRGLEDAPEKLFYRSAFLDAVRLIELVMALPEVDEARVGVTGESQGGAMALVGASLVPSVKRVGVYYPFLCDYKRVWEMDRARDTYVELADFFRQRDPLHQAEDEIFTKLGYIDVKNFVKWIRGEVLMGVGLMDTIVPPSTQFSAYNRITSKKDLRIYPDYGHEPIPHYSDEVFRFLMGL